MKKTATQKVVIGAVLSAIVFLLQIAGASLRFGPFSVSFVLVPIVIGAASCGKSIGAWLGFVFGAAVLLSGDAGVFLAVSVPGTIITVLVKGIACGFIAAIVYSLIEKYNIYAAAVLAAVVCPVVNTGVFLLCCRLFFMETITEWAGGADVFKYMIFGLVGGNFIFELLANIILAPGIATILNIVVKSKR